jgi:hypothetical protein
MPAAPIATIQPAVRNHQCEVCHLFVGGEDVVLTGDKPGG